jgi:50S ribosomal protein L16 3-hydroxylase
MKLRLGCTPSQFLARYWQKKPCLIRQALPGFDSPISANDLAGLACMPGALARLVQGSGKRFSLEHGPFSEDRFATLGKKNWTLLVQDVDKWDPQVRTLLQYFSFLPRWRIEDVMVSYAVSGGSVGAHVDQYDVFLLQARGSRRWQIDQSPSPPQGFLPNAPLKLLRSFTPDFDAVLEPGDMLYLPPGIPHHGVSTSDDCLSFSIGLRAPSVAELYASIAEEFLSQDEQRLTDVDLQATKNAALIDRSQLARVRAALQQAAAMNDTALSDWFGRFITSYRSARMPTLPKVDAAKLGAAAAAKFARGKSLGLDPFLRSARRFDRKKLYLAGQALSPSARLQTLLSTPDARIHAADFSACSSADQTMILQLLRVRALTWQGN